MGPTGCMTEHGRTWQNMAEENILLTDLGGHGEASGLGVLREGGVADREAPRAENVDGVGEGSGEVAALARVTAGDDIPEDVGHIAVRAV